LGGGQREHLVLPPRLAHRQLLGVLARRPFELGVAAGERVEF